MIYRMIDRHEIAFVFSWPQDPCLAVGGQVIHQKPLDEVFMGSARVLRLSFIYFYSSTAWIAACPPPVARTTASAVVSDFGCQ